MRSVQDGISITLLQASLLASLVDLGRTTGDVAGLNTTSSKLGGTVGEGRSLDRAEKLAAFSGFVSNIMSWMGRGDTSRKGKGGEKALERRHSDNFNDSWYCLENDLEETDARDEDIEIAIQLQKLILYIYREAGIPPPLSLSNNPHTEWH
jgi:hypothetical protein